MKFFDEQGCLTEEALLAVIQGQELTQLRRLEIAEHLSFCDACLERYSTLLSEETLLTPPQPVWQQVSLRLRRRMERFIFHRVTAAVLAAGFSLAFLFGGTFLLDTGLERDVFSPSSFLQEPEEASSAHFVMTGEKELFLGRDMPIWEKPWETVWDFSFFTFFDRGADEK